MARKGEGAKRTFESVLDSLKDRDKDVRRQAVEALSEIEHPKAVEALEGALSDPSVWVRERAAEALGNFSTGTSLKPLLKALADDAAVVRSAAAESLGKLGDARAGEALIGLLGDEDKWVRESAAKALAAIAEKPAAEALCLSLGDPSFDVRTAAMEALVQIGKPAVSALIGALKGGDWQIRLKAATLLGRIADAAALDPLIKALGDRNAAVRKSVAGALCAFDDPRIEEEFAKAAAAGDLAVFTGAHRYFIANGKPEYQDLMVRALDHFGDSELATALLSCGNPQLAGVAASWLFCHSPEVDTSPNPEAVQWGGGEAVLGKTKPKK